MKKQRLYQIDLLRFICAFSVMFYHLTFFGYGFNKTESQFPVLGEVFKYGFVGVGVFFMISGFVISLSLERVNVFNFLKSRFIRLYPAYWVCLIITVIVVFFFESNNNLSWSRVFYNLTMIQTYFEIPNIDGSYWTLWLELKFYLLGLVVLIINRVLKKNVMFIVALLWLCISVYYLLSKIDIVPNFDYLGEVLMLRYSCYFIGGIFLYNIYRNDFTIFNVISLLICLLLSIYHEDNNSHILEDMVNENFSSFYITTILVVVSYLLLLLISVGKLNFLNKKKFVILGAISYPMYLIHQHIGYICFNQLGVFSNKYFILGGYTTLVLLIGYLISRYIENPATNYLKKLFG